MPYEGRDTKRMFPVVKVRTMAIVITATSAVRCLPSGLHTRSLGAGHADLRRAPQPAPLLGWTSRDAKGHLPLHCFFSMGFYNLDEIRMDSQGSELKARLVSVPIREPDGGHHPTTVGLSDAPPPPPPRRGAGVCPGFQTAGCSATEGEASPPGVPPLHPLNAGSRGQ